MTIATTGIINAKIEDNIDYVALRTAIKNDSELKENEAKMKSETDYQSLLILGISQNKRLQELKDLFTGVSP